jgi:hypothetical protein
MLKIFCTGIACRGRESTVVHAVIIIASCLIVYRGCESSYRDRERAGRGCESTSPGHQSVCGRKIAC